MISEDFNFYLFIKNYLAMQQINYQFKTFKTKLI